MADNTTKVIGIELTLLEELVRKAVHEEIQLLADDIKSTLTSKAESLLHEERLYTNQVAQLFGKTRHTISNYVQQGLLPQPNRDLSDRPYWKPEQLEQSLNLRGIKTKFPI